MRFRSIALYSALCVMLSTPALEARRDEVFFGKNKGEKIISDEEQQRQLSNAQIGLLDSLNKSVAALSATMEKQSQEQNALLKQLVAINKAQAQAENESSEPNNGTVGTSRNRPLQKETQTIVKSSQEELILLQKMLDTQERQSRALGELGKAMGLVPVQLRNYQQQTSDQLQVLIDTTAKASDDPEIDPEAEALQEVAGLLRELIQEVKATGVQEDAPGN